jgi:hypothetical protein
MCSGCMGVEKKSVGVNGEFCKISMTDCLVLRWSNHQTSPSGRTADGCHMSRRRCAVHGSATGFGGKHRQAPSYITAYFNLDSVLTGNLAQYVGVHLMYGVLIVHQWGIVRSPKTALCLLIIVRLGVLAGKSCSSKN